LVDLPDVDQTLNFDILGMTMGYENVSLGLWHLYCHSRIKKQRLALDLDWTESHIMYDVFDPSETRNLIRFSVCSLWLLFVIYFCWHRLNVRCLLCTRFPVLENYGIDSAYLYIQNPYIYWVKHFR